METALCHIMQEGPGIDAVTPEIDFGESSPLLPSCSPVTNSPVAPSIAVLENKRTASPSLINLPIPELKPPVKNSNRAKRLPNYLVARSPDLSTRSAKSPRPYIQDPIEVPRESHYLKMKQDDPVNSHHSSDSHNFTAVSQKGGVLNISSFLIGLCSGITLVVVKPTLQYLLTQGLTTLSTVLSYLVIWGAIGGIVWIFFKQVIEQKGSEPDQATIAKPVPFSPATSSAKSRSSALGSPRHSPTRHTASSASSRRNSNRSVLAELDDQVSASYRSPRSTSPQKDEFYAFRPYGNPWDQAQPPLHHPGQLKTKKKSESTSPTMPHSSGSQSNLPITPPLEFFSGDDLLFLEKPSDQIAYKLH